MCQQRLVCGGNLALVLLIRLQIAQASPNMTPSIIKVRLAFILEMNFLSLPRDDF